MKMLDTHGRKFLKGFISKGADFFIKLGLSPNNVTFLAFLLGVTASFFLFYKFEILAVVILWFSGYLDAVDGEMARKTNQTSDYGALMDIVFDRIVEGGIIIALAIRFEDSRMLMIGLMFSIIISMTIFLTVGALSQKRGIKSFYYQAGLAERTEGFIMFTLMILLTRWLNIITIIFTVMILFTALQRMKEARKLLV